MASANFRRASFWPSLRFRGISTRMVTYWSPLPRPLRTGTPLPRRRRVVPGWVPGSTLHLIFPSREGISISPPMAAW